MNFIMFKNIKKRILIFLFSLFFSLQLFAQMLFSTGEYSLSLTASAGAAYLYGDVAGIERVSSIFTDLKFQDVRYMIGGGVRHTPNKYFSHKLGFAYGYFTANEKEDTRSSNRGYAYKAQLWQLWWQPELTLFRTKNTKTYTYTGIGVVHSSSRMTGAPIRPADTFKGSEVAALMPFGVGYEVALSRRISLGAEVVCYYYFSDFIDGITTPFSRSNDAVGAVLLSFSYKIFKDHRQRYYYWWIID
jgi:hypothetical protein